MVHCAIKVEDDSPSNDPTDVKFRYVGRGLPT
jgi:hypothetical protein